MFSLPRQRLTALQVMVKYDIIIFSILIFLNELVLQEIKLKITVEEHNHLMDIFVSYKTDERN